MNLPKKAQKIAKRVLKPIKSKKTINYHKLLQEVKKKNNIKISALIPAYNEGPRILHVLEVSCRYPFIDEIVVVNDGSTDNTAEVVKDFAKKCRKIVFVNLRKNQGKTDAVKKGMQRVSGDLVVMLDADLQNLKDEYLDKMLYLVASKQYDMVILDRGSDRLTPVGLLGLARINGGERAFWKSEFEKVDLRNIKNYSLEGALNLHFLKAGKKVRTVLAPDLKATTQLKKWGVPKALMRYAKEFWEIYKASGFRNYYVQLTEIEEEPIVEIYSWYRKAKRRKAIKEMARVGVLVATAVASVGLIGYLLARKVKNGVKDSREK